MLPVGDLRSSHRPHGVTQVVLPIRGELHDQAAIATIPSSMTGDAKQRKEVRLRMASSQAVVQCEASSKSVLQDEAKQSGDVALNPRSIPVAIGLELRELRNLSADETGTRRAHRRRSGSHRACPRWIWAWPRKRREGLRKGQGWTKRAEVEVKGWRPIERTTWLANNATATQMATVEARATKTSKAKAN